MHHRTSIAAFALAALIAASATAPAPAQDISKYPDWTAQWRRMHGIQWDPGKPPARGQQAPLTPEYQALFEWSLADQAAGGQGNNPRVNCLPHGMPRVMTSTYPMEIIVLPKTTYMIFENQPVRRIFTDGRDWPKDAEPGFVGVSLGTWIDEDGDGSYDTLEVETRGMTGPRNFEASGLPLHKDNATVVKERLYLDQANKDVLVDEVTTIDNALTRPWTVTKRYRREHKPIWFENNCEDNHHVMIGKDNYFVSADGYLMPTKKGQAPPDLKYFNQVRK